MIHFKNLLFIIGILFLMTNCSNENNDSSKQIHESYASEIIETTSDISENDEANDLLNETQENDDISPLEESEKISFDSYSYPKIANESEIKKDFLDRTNRTDCKIYKFKFSDGVEGTLVERNGEWYSYSVWGKKREKLFSKKEDGLQKIWEEGTNLRNVGGAIGSGLAGKKNVPLKKDGTPDMRYSVNK